MGSQAERVFTASNLRPYMAGATVTSVNGKSFKGTIFILGLFVCLFAC